MEAARTRLPREELELSVLEQQQEELTPLNSLQIQPSSADSPNPAQTDKESPWSPCNKIVVGKCKLWMVIVTIFLCFTIVIIISLCLVGGKDSINYVDAFEDLVERL
ncbi:hypothetical protein A6R68_09501 [Neotoma lepida]|uniref:TPA-induced transmembrane protein n=1 Tax=Neotoma lepida TaxID=56216 RepID=A0A1A6FZL3_NEOLE|nr:hypothetical protein A6R68_09501 [Neotoma lepida]